MPTGPLARALAALDQGNDAAALDAIGDAWRARRSPELAELAALLERRSPSALRRQLDGLQAPRVAVALERFQALAEVDDPLLSSYVLDALERPPFVGASAEPLLAALVATAERLRDPRLCDRADAIVRVWQHRVTPRPARLRLEEALEGALLAIERERPPLATAEEARLEAALGERLRAVSGKLRSTAELVADVYANPHDDGPRLVLADFLLEHGDPADPRWSPERGELIALQFQRRAGKLDAAGAAREQALLKQHGKAWLGPLAPVVGWGKSYASTSFERGFVSRADINISAGRKIRLVFAEPSWATVEELYGHFEFELLEQAPFTGLRRIENWLVPDGVRRLAARARPLPLVEVMLRGVPDGALLRQALPCVEVFTVFLSAPTLETVARLLAELDGAPRRRLLVDRFYSEQVTDDQRVAFDALVAGVASLPVTLPELALRPPFRPPQPGPLELRAINGRYQPVDALAEHA